MSVKKTNHVIVNSISELHNFLGLPKPEHPLISLIKLEGSGRENGGLSVSLTNYLYSISLKRNIKGKLKYGRNYYDFDDGVMALMSPGQVISSDNSSDYEVTGWWLVFHPDLIRNYPLNSNINNFGYFSYDVHEALHLSSKEGKSIESIFKIIMKEYQSSIDIFSQDLIVSQLEVLLNYANRYYNRQFITRKAPSNDLLVKMESLLQTYFKSDLVQKNGLPTVNYIAGKLKVSPNYLSDMLRTHTGQNAQQHIHHHLIEKAKELLISKSLSVSETAFKLGFEYPQYFSRLFKSKTGMSPSAYKSSVN